MIAFYSKFIVTMALILLLGTVPTSYINNNESADKDTVKKEIVLETNSDEFEITDTVKEISSNIFNEGCIRNETAAIEIASSIFESVYGEDFDNGMPLSASYNEKMNTWLVKTQLPDGSDGGNKYIVLKKSNAEVVAIWATK